MLGPWRCQVMQSLLLLVSEVCPLVQWPLCCIVVYKLLPSELPHLSCQLPAASWVWTAPTGFIFLSPNWTAQAYFVVVNGIYVLVSRGQICAATAAGCSMCRAHCRC